MIGVCAYVYIYVYMYKLVILYGDGQLTHINVLVIEI